MGFSGLVLRRVKLWKTPPTSRLVPCLEPLTLTSCSSFSGLHTVVLRLDLLAQLVHPTPQRLLRFLPAAAECFNHLVHELLLELLSLLRYHTQMASEVTKPPLLRTCHSCFASAHDRQLSRLSRACSKFMLACFLRVKSSV